MADNLRPNYYKGKTGKQVIDLIDKFNLDFWLGNALKYVIRAGRKTESKQEDLLKAITYLQDFLKRGIKRRVLNMYTIQDANDITIEFELVYPYTEIVRIIVGIEIHSNNGTYNIPNAIDLLKKIK